MFFIVPHLYCQTAVGDATEVAGRPRAAAVSDGELHFQQELQDAQNEIKVSSQKYFSSCNGEETSFHLPSKLTMSTSRFE